MLTSLILYYFLAFIPSFLIYRSYYLRKKRVLSFFCVLIACSIQAFFFAARYKTGTDWDTYYDHYSYASFSNTWNKSLLEPGYYYLAAICNYFNLSFFWFSFVCSCLMELAILRALNSLGLQRTRWLGFFIATFTIYFVSYNIVRQMMATSFLLLGYSIFKKRKYLWSLLIFLVAISFHKTAIIGIVFILVVFVYNVLSLRSKKESAIASAAIVVFCLLLSIVVILTAKKIGFYQGGEYSAHSFNVLELRFLLYYVPEWILLFMFLKQKNSKKVYECFSLFILACVFQILACVYPFVDRLSWYFLIFRIILYPMVLADLHGKKNTKFVFLSISWFVVYFFALFFVMGGDEIFPYQSMVVGII